MVRALTIVVLILSCACVGPAAQGAEGEIVLKKGIAGVRLGMSYDDVRAVIGEPAGTGDSELHGGWTKWTYRTPKMRVTFTERGRVWDVRTYASRHRTAQDAGVGSTERQVRKALRVVTCRPYGGTSRSRTWRVCIDRRDYDGAFTSFLLVRGRVTHVTVAAGIAR